MPENPLIYLSKGNIPSAAANTMQVMKMASALSKEYSPFVLVTGKHLLERKNSGFSFEEWYGLQDVSFVTRIPSGLCKDYPYPAGYVPKLYRWVSLVYLMMRRPCRLFTRNADVVPWALRLGISTVLETHQGKPFKESYYRNLKSHPLFKGLVVISPYMVEMHSRYLPLEKIRFLEDGVDLASYEVRCTKGELQRELEIEMGGYSHLAVFTGHLYPNRGIEEILIVAAQLPNILFLLVGGWEEDLRKRDQEIQQKRLANVRLTGFKPNIMIPKYQQAADILLIPYSSKLDTVKWFSSLKLFEYMASGTPIIASNLERISSVLNEDSGYLIPPDDPTALMNVIKEICAHPEEAHYKAQKAREVVKQYTWQQRAKEILNLYTSNTCI
jgi:glycosyltransferase involved in cell wall biosynthesis